MWGERENHDLCCGYVLSWPHKTKLREATKLSQGVYGCSEDQAHSFDTTCSCAINPITNKAQFEILKDVLKSGDNNKILASKYIWVVDKNRIQPWEGSFQKQRFSISNEIAIVKTLLFLL